MTKSKIGLLPLYLELYDKALPQARERMESFYSTIVSQLEKRNIDVVTSQVCRLEPEFAAAVKSFEDAECNAIVTLHLAYSPSLESASVLAATKLPLIVLDTTPGYSFTPAQDPIEIMFNHGIHGAQDMCNLLIRNGKSFQIEAGHWEKSDVLDRVAGWCKGALIASKMRSARVGRIGSAFAGMGDFALPAEELRESIGVETIVSDAKGLQSLVPDANSQEVRAEIQAETFVSDGVPLEARAETARACIAVRRWLDEARLTAFTMNFLEVGGECGLPTAPFLEASKAMARGLGYAGEGDVLTAALVGALASVFPDTTFTEMFCPDWSGNSIFLSHMGEMNLNLAIGKPRLRVMDFPWADAPSPVFAVGGLRGGEAVLVNLAPGLNGAFTLIIAPIEMLFIKGKDNMENTIHGWFQPEMPVPRFLEEYSRVGGTHHLALVYGDVATDIARFGELMGWKIVYLGSGVV